MAMHPSDSVTPDHGSPDEVGGGGTILDDRPQTSEVEAGDHERFAHIVEKHKIVESAVTGTPVVALCGKVWVPGRDPGKFPVCPTCREIYESDALHGEGEALGGGS